MSKKSSVLVRDEKGKLFVMDASDFRIAKGWYTVLASGDFRGGYVSGNAGYRARVFYASDGNQYLVYYDASASLRS